MGYYLVGDIAGSGNILMPLARHVTAGLGLVYPLKDEIDMTYIENLETPEGPMHFDDIFDRAIKNVEGMWATVVQGVLKDDKAYAEKIGNWNLDTGKDKQGQLVYWEE